MVRGPTPRAGFAGQADARTPHEQRWAGLGTNGYVRSGLPADGSLPVGWWMVGPYAVNARGLGRSDVNGQAVNNQ